MIALAEFEKLITVFGLVSGQGVLSFFPEFMKLLGFKVYNNVIVATTEDLDSTYYNGSFGVGATLTSNIFTKFFADGVFPVLGSRVQVRAQDAPSENGIYVLTQVGDVGSSTPWILTRAVDFDETIQIQPNYCVYVVGGETQRNTFWRVSSLAPVAIGTSHIDFSIFNIFDIFQIKLVAGSGITITPNAFDDTITSP